ncbi:MAG TPA: endolytic transglycosylase MltG [Desulfosalsimonadaceae bacterium]|nr:endolytic transglycosylase MltG [Desulfosalsimonadaceae bacterium]
MRKKLATGALFAFLVCAAALVCGIGHLYRYAHTPIRADSTQTATLTIHPGDSFQDVVSRLESAGIVQQPLRLKIIAQWKKRARSIQAGEYRISAQMTPLALLKTLSLGKVVLHRVTIPEGFTLAQIGARLEKKGLAGKQAFLDAAEDPGLTEELGIPADTVEGYLFPDTYRFAKSAGPEKIIATMAAEMRENIPAEWNKRAEELGLSMHQVLTLASIIEKETSAPRERPLISSVFHNRLDKDMRLETDPTVIYGIKDFDGNLTRADLNTRTPYNTYRIRGLPPGPIANPSRAAIHAALYPADTEYLYFVAKPDRTHHFSRTLAEHNKAVRKYQLSSGSP